MTGVVAFKTPRAPNCLWLHAGRIKRWLCKLSDPECLCTKRGDAACCELRWTRLSHHLPSATQNVITKLYFPEETRRLLEDLFSIPPNPHPQPPRNKRVIINAGHRAANWPPVGRRCEDGKREKMLVLGVGTVSNVSHPYLCL